MSKKGTSPSFTPMADSGPGDLIKAAKTANPALSGRAPRGPSPKKTKATRQSIIDAAFAEFLEYGYARGTTMSVAQRAGVSKVTLFRYFQSKEALFEAVILSHITPASLALQEHPIREGESVAAFLLRTVAPVMDVLDSSGRAATARLVVAEGLEFPLLAQMYRRNVIDPVVAHIGTLAQLAHERGELRHPGLLSHPEWLLAPLWLAMANNTVLRPEAPLDAGALFRMQVDLLLHTPEPATPAAKAPRVRKSKS